MKLASHSQGGLALPIEDICNLIRTGIKLQIWSHGLHEDIQVTTKICIYIAPLMQ